jgi:hypothetical protein
MARRGFRVGKQRQSTLNRSVRQGMAPVQIRIRNPWEGFTPDVSYHGEEASGTSGWRGLMVWGDYLLTRDGFEAIRDDVGEITLGFVPVSTATTSLRWALALSGGGQLTRGWQQVGQSSRSRLSVGTSTLVLARLSGKPSSSLTRLRGLLLESRLLCLLLPRSTPASSCVRLMMGRLIPGTPSSS